MTPHAERAGDLLDALEALVRQRNAEPDAYRVVHAAATAAVTRLHDDLLDPRTGDVAAVEAAHADAVRRLRQLPRPTAGQTGPGGGAAGGRGRVADLEPLLQLLRGARTTGSTVDRALGDLTSEVIPQVERVLRDGLSDLFGRLSAQPPAEPASPEHPSPAAGPTAPGDPDDV
jgi:hypothetical protein